MTTLFNRRTILRGLGVTMALPWFESLPAFADDDPQQEGNQPPVRLAVLFAGKRFSQGPMVGRKEPALIWSLARSLIH